MLWVRRWRGAAGRGKGRWLGGGRWQPALSQPRTPASLARSRAAAVLRGPAATCSIRAGRHTFPADPCAGARVVFSGALGRGIINMFGLFLLIAFLGYGFVEVRRPPATLRPPAAPTRCAHPLSARTHDAAESLRCRGTCCHPLLLPPCCPALLPRPAATPCCHPAATLLLPGGTCSARLTDRLTD